jgi:FAD synthetase
MKTVVATGVFEILHPGHIQYLEQARRLGERLVVIVASDEVALKRKRRPVISEGQRLHMVGALKPVDEAVLGGTGDIYETIRSLGADVIALGPDQDFNIEAVREGLMERGISADVVRIGDYWDAGLHSTRIIVDLIRKDESR